MHEKEQFNVNRSFFMVVEEGLDRYFCLRLLSLKWLVGRCSDGVNLSDRSPDQL